jgi:hypothetical protein
MFKLLLKNDLELGAFDPEDITVSEAIYSAYNSLTDCLTIIWNDFSKEIGYKTDVSDSFNDIIKMLNNIKEGKEYFVMEFPSQSFFELWKCRII